MSSFTPHFNENTSEVGAMPQASPSNYFALLGLPLRYAVDPEELERRYLERSRQVHPDRFVGAEAGERVKALGASMELNEAVKALRDPVRRAEHLLLLFGVAIGTNEQLDPTFLMEILEAREELAEAQTRGDQAEVMRLEEEMQQRRDASIEAVAERFAAVESGETGAGRDALLAQIKRELILLRYVDRYLEAAVDEELD